MIRSFLDPQLESLMLAPHVRVGSIPSVKILLTGRTEVLFGDALFSAYTKAIPGAKLDKESGLLEIPESSISKLRPLTFDIGGRPFTVDAGSQVVPTTENSAWGGDPAKHYSIVGSLGLDVGDGMNFVLGASFLERFYAVRASAEFRTAYVLMKLPQLTGF